MKNMFSLLSLGFLLSLSPISAEDPKPEEQKECGKCDHEHKTDDEKKNCDKCKEECKDHEMKKEDKKEDTKEEKKEEK